MQVSCVCALDPIVNTAVYVVYTPYRHHLNVLPLKCSILPVYSARYMYAFFHVNPKRVQVIKGHGYTNTTGGIMKLSLHCGLEVTDD